MAWRQRVSPGDLIRVVSVRIAALRASALPIVRWDVRGAIDLSRLHDGDVFEAAFVVDEFGEANYRIMLNDALWRVYRMVSKLEGVAFGFDAPGRLGMPL